MRIDLASLPDQELSALIMGAMKEWASRQPAHQETQIVRQPAPKPRIITVREPSQEEKDIVLNIKARLIEGELIVAAERAKVAELASQYPEWMGLQRMPHEKGTKAWREAAEFYRWQGKVQER